MNVSDNFDSGTVINTTLWESAVLNSGSQNYISSGALYLKQTSGWSGGYVRTKDFTTLAQLKSFFQAEFDIQVVGSYHVSSAGVNPCFGFTCGTTTRDTTYYYSPTSHNLVFQLDSNASLTLGRRDGGSENTTNFTTITSGVNLSNSTHIKIVIKNSNLSIYLNNSTTPVLNNYALSSAAFVNLTDDIRFEFYLGNYSSGQYMKIDNAVFKSSLGSFLIEDGTDIKTTTDGTTVTLIQSGTPTKTTFDTYGIQDLTKITPTVISKLSNQKYKIAMQKK